MVQQGRRLGFVFEPLKLPWIEHRGGGKNLQRNPPIERDLLRFVNDSHAATTDFANDAIVADPFAGAQGSIGLRPGQSLGRQLTVDLLQGVRQLRSLTWESPQVFVVPGRLSPAVAYAVFLRD